jgi:hypothetical protein
MDPGSPPLEEATRAHLGASSLSRGQLSSITPDHTVRLKKPVLTLGRSRRPRPAATTPERRQMATEFAGMPDEGLAFLEDLDSVWGCGGRLGRRGGSARTRPVPREKACIQRMINLPGSRALRHGDAGPTRGALGAGFLLRSHQPSRLGLTVGSTGVYRLPVTLGDVLREIGEVAGGVEITVDPQTAGLTGEGALGQGELGFHPATARARLG